MRLIRFTRNFWRRCGQTILRRSVGSCHATRSSGNPSYDTVVLKKVDANSFEGTLKKSGKVVQTVTNVVLKDGKVMTVTARGTTAKGQKFTSVTVLEKQ